MADTQRSARTYLASPAVIVLFLLLIAPLIIPALLTGALFLPPVPGLADLGSDLLISYSLPLLVFTSDLTFGLVTLADFHLLVATYIVLAYIVAVVVVALVRLAYQAVEGSSPSEN